jgi:hypothetical protein
LTIFLFPGEKIFPEKELTHLDGHKGSKPVRIGNGAIDHIQLVRMNLICLTRLILANLQDIYGELCDEPLFPLVAKITDIFLGWIVYISPKR